MPQGYDFKASIQVFDLATSGPDLSVGACLGIELSPDVVTVGMPVVEEIGQLCVRHIRQHNSQGQILVAALAGLSADHALAFEAQFVSRVGAFRDTHGYGAVDGGNLDTCAEYCFVKCYRKLDVYVVAITRKRRVRSNANLDQGIASGTVSRARVSFSLQPDSLAVIDPGWNGHVDGLAVRQGKATGTTLGGLEETDLHGVAAVTASRAHACTAALAAGAKKRREDIVGVEASESEIVESETFEGPGSGALAGSSVRVSPLMLHSFVARGIDFPAVVSTARLGIAQYLISRGDFLEPFGRAGVSRMTIGMKFLGQIAIGRLDVVLTCVTSDTKDLVGIHHTFLTMPNSAGRADLPCDGNACGRRMKSLQAFGCQMVNAAQRITRTGKHVDICVTIS